MLVHASRTRLYQAGKPIEISGRQAIAEPGASIGLFYCPPFGRKV